MKRTANIMNVKFNTLFYTALFSGLGVFSFLLLINYAAFPDKVADIFHSVGTLSFFVLAFNVLGYATMRLSTWVDNQYALNLHRRWKLISVYVVVMGMFFLLNYGLLVTAKLLAGASHPFMFPNGGWRILITVWLVELVILGLLLANRSIRNALKLQQEAAALQKENNTARYTALQNQLNPHFLFNSLNTLISEIRYNPANAELFTQHLSDVSIINRTQHTKVSGNCIPTGTTTAKIDFKIFQPFGIYLMKIKVFTPMKGCHNVQSTSIHMGSPKVYICP